MLDNYFKKNKLGPYLKNFYFLSSLSFILIYVFKSLFFNMWDINYLYITALKSNIQTIYSDFSFQHGPYLNFFFEFLTLIKSDPYIILYVLGIFQSLCIGYLAYLFACEITESKYVRKISFLITVFFVNSGYNFFYWDLYSFLLSSIGFYLVVVKKKNILGVFLLSFVFFCKQSFGVTSFLILTFFSLANFLYFKKKEYLLNIALFFIFSLFFVLVIYFFSDLNKFYNENVLMIFKYSSLREKDIFSYLFNIFTLLPDIHSINDLKHNLSLAGALFYMIFKLPLFLICVLLLFSIKDFYKNYYQLILLLIFISILTTPLLGRGYWSTLYFIPAINILFFNYLCENKKIFSISVIQNKDNLIFLYVFLIFSFLIANNIKDLNLSDQIDKQKIKSNKNFLLNLDQRNNFPTSDRSDIIDMSKFVYDKKINSIYLLDEDSAIILVINSIPSLNNDIVGKNIIKDPFFSWDMEFPIKGVKYKDRFLKDFKIKNSKYVLYHNNNFQKNSIFFPKNFLINYDIFYSNSNFTLLKRKDD